MTANNETGRIAKLDEAKELLARLEDEKDMKLGGPRGALMRAGQSVSVESAYMNHMQKAGGQITGLAIEGGYDEIASDVAALIEELHATEQGESK
jgi:16S rRNA G527 N7-methylase RsmG